MAELKGLVYAFGARLSHYRCIASLRATGKLKLLLAPLKANLRHRALQLQTRETHT